MEIQGEKLVLSIVCILLSTHAIWAQCKQPTAHITGAANGNPSQGLVLNNFVPDTSTLAGSIMGTDLNGSLDWSNCGDLTFTRPASASTILAISAGNTVQELSTTAVVWSMTLAALNPQLDALQLPRVIDLNHEAVRLPGGLTAMIGHVEQLVDCGQYPAQCPNGPTVGNSIDVMASAVIVVDQTGTVSWYWNPYLHLDLARPAILGETCTPQINNGGCPVTLAPVANDWNHSNSIWFDPADCNLVVNVRNQDWVVKIDYNNGWGTGNVLWRLGNGGDFTLQNTAVVWPWFSHAHDVTSYAPGKYTLYDNGNTRISPPPSGLGSGTSRGQAYTIDERAMTATLSFSVDLKFFSPGSGSAQSLSNRNFWFLSGRPVNPANGKTFSQGVEVTPAGKIIYLQNYAVKQYRSNRFASFFMF